MSNIFGFYKVTGEMEYIECPRCSEQISIGDDVARVDSPLPFPMGFFSGGSLHIYQIGEYYHQRCVDYKENRQTMECK